MKFSYTTVYWRQFRCRNIVKLRELMRSGDIMCGQRNYSVTLVVKLEYKFILIDDELIRVITSI